MENSKEITWDLWKANGKNKNDTVLVAVWVRIHLVGAGI